MLMTNAANTGRRVPLALLLAPTTAAAHAFHGYVQMIYSTGDFVLVVGNVSYTAVISPATTVLNLRGRQIPQQFMTAGQVVTVTGTLLDSKIDAQSVVVPTRKEAS